MKTLPEYPTVAQVKEFLAAVEPKDDADKPARRNSSLTRHQAWEIFDQAIRAHQEERGLEDSDHVVRPDWEKYARTDYRERLIRPVWMLIIRNINREFGGR